MRVLVACEYSGRVRDAFIARGHDAWSCDLLPTDRPGPHIQGDVRNVLYDGWDLMVAHPACTFLTVAANWCLQDEPRFKPKPGTLYGAARRQAQAEALDFVRLLLDEPSPEMIGGGWKSHGIPKVALENPVGVISTKIRKPDQTIQPWQFGENASKATCLWLRGLPLLVPTNVLPGGKAARRANQTASGQNRLGPSPDRWKIRSETYQGIANAFAEQWSSTGIAKPVGQLSLLG